MSSTQLIRDSYGRTVGKELTDERLIFLFASGERCGSTLLQRYLTSHPDVFIWGEQHGALRSLADFYRTASLHAETYRGVTEAFAAKGVDEFIANLCPSLDAIANATRSALMNLFGGFARRWGCKEVRCGQHVVEMLVDLFPETRCVLLVRDVKDCLSSLVRWNVSLEFCEDVVQRWNTLAIEFLECRRLWETNVLLIRYEDLMQDSISVTKAVCDFLHLDHDEMDSSVFNLRVADHSHIEEVSTASPRERVALSKDLDGLWRSEIIQSTRRALCYS